jgi:hypothetical protein
MRNSGTDGPVNYKRTLYNAAERQRLPRTDNVGHGFEALFIIAGIKIFDGN